MPGFWSQAETLAVDAFRPEGSDHRPVVTVRALYDPAALFVRFDVRDRFVRCIHTHYGDLVHKDSCVELFLQPRAPGGYVNIEANCGGTLFCSCIEDPRRVSGGFARWQRVPREYAAAIVVSTNLPPLVDPEITGEVDWWVELTVPFEVLARYVGGAPPRPGDRWRGNFYKCGDETTHPHWGAWSPVGELDFHRPQDFGMLVFEP